MKINAFFLAILAASAACSESGAPPQEDGTGGRAGGGGAGAGSGGSGGMEPGCDTPCGESCCSTGDVCLDAPFAYPSVCTRECVTNSWCSDPAAPCCMLLPDGGGACTNDNSVVKICRCAGDLECPTGNCAPYSQDGIPQGPNVCVPTDGAPYNGCAANVPCGAGYCCLEAASSHFCAIECATDADCGSEDLWCYLDILGGGCSGCIPR